MCLKPELIALVQFLKAPPPNVLKVSDFVLYVIYNRPSTENNPGDSHYAMLFGEKREKSFTVLISCCLTNTH